MTTRASPYQLTIDGFAPDHLRVHALTGKETISEAWWFDVVVTGETGDDLERAALAQRATLVFDVGEKQRAFYGVVAAVRVDEVHLVDRRVKYVLRIVPRLWLLKRKKRSRIFQHMRIPDIASAILLEAGITSRWQLTRAYPEREYCTQYEETDYQFLRRILAEAGIYFYFFGGGPVDAAALVADAAVGAAASIGSTAVGFVAGESVGSLVGSAAQMAETLIPGDTIVGADDASCYPPVGGDDPAALAAATAAAMASAIGDAIGVGGGVAGAVVGTASAVAGTVIADVLEGASVPVLHFMNNEAARVSTHDKITRFTLRNTVRSSAAAFRDYDPERPMVRLQSAAVSTQPFPPSPFELAAQVAATVGDVASAASGLVPGPVGSALGTAGDAIATVDSAVNQVAGALGQKVPFEVYEHHDHFLFPRWAFANDEAPRILRQKRRRASIADGEGGCSDFSPAHRFTLRDHPATQLDGTYVITSVEHRGEVRPTDAETWKVYWNRFECAPAEMPYPPKRPKRKSVQVALTATVVGPAGEEIHVDDKGQIRVQFHWDREGKYDDRSSCWIRTMQPWGGAAWGHQFIPRVGMEVVVVFEGGDPDKPMVLGSLYNGTHPAPFLLPQDKTRSGIRTQSTPGGGGFNELSFEDAIAKEQIYLHAQRDLDEVVERNHTLLVKNDELIRILGSRLDKIEKNLEEHVTGDHVSHVQGNRVDVVTGNADRRVTGMLVTRVEGKERHSVQGQADVEHADDLTTRVLGCMTTLVGKNDKKRSWVTHAEGTVELSSSDLNRVSSEKELVLAVGKSSIRITAEKIEFNAPSLAMAGKGGGLGVSDEGLAMKSKDGTKMSLDSQAVIQTKAGASVALGSQVKADAPQILLNSPEQAKDQPAKDPEPPTKIELKDQDGGALGYQRFLITLDDGSEVSGMTDKDGKAELELDQGGKVVFPDLTMPGDEAKGTMKPYVVRQGDYLKKLSFVHGFDADKVWNDPKNAELKDKRKSPNLLHPGDLLHFPRAKREGQALQKGTTNTYSAKVPKTTVRLGFKNDDGPLANEPYTIEGLGAPVEGSTDGDGMISIDVPVHLREVQVVFPKQNVLYPVRIGDMDPVEEMAGVRKRLEHLGYRAPEADEAGGASEADVEERDRRAIAAFQRAQGLEPTGTLDDATRDALVKAHGS